MVDQKREKDKGNSTSHGDILGEEAVKYEPEPESLTEKNSVPGWAFVTKYPHQGSYTLSDYLAIPDGKRAELIDGAIYDMASPNTIHQIIQRGLLGA